MSSIREMLPQLARDALAQVDDSEYEVVNMVWLDTAGVVVWFTQVTTC